MVVAANQDGQQNVVIKIYWSYTATDGTFTATNEHGYTNMTYIPGNPFTPYQNLTEADVVNWVLGSWTPDQLQANQQFLAKSIAAQQAAAYKFLPLPWN